MEEFLEEYIEKNFIEDCLGKDIKDISQEELNGFYRSQMNQFYNRKKTLRLMHKIPLAVRRSTMEYRAALDENGRAYSDMNRIKVKDLSIKHMEAILKWTDFEYSSSDNLLLHTINEELIQRKWGKVG